MTKAIDTTPAAEDWDATYEQFEQTVQDHTDALNRHATKGGVREQQRLLRLLGRYNDGERSPQLLARLKAVE